MGKKEELEILTQNILESLNELDEGVDVKEWLKVKLREYLLIEDEEELEKTAQGLLKGIKRYKMTKQALEKEPSVFSRIWNSLKDALSPQVDEVVKEAEELKKIREEISEQVKGEE